MLRGSDCRVRTRPSQADQDTRQPSDQRLRGEYDTSGKADLARALFPYLTDSADLPSYRAVAADLGLSEGAVKVAVHRLRQRCGAILRAEVAETVSGEKEIDAELRELLKAVST